MIWVLPGFLGQEQDFKVLNNYDYKVVPLFKAHDELQLIGNKEQWIQNFIQYVKQQKHSSNILLGYSFGGRLAAAVLEAYPEIFKAGVFISANPMSLTPEQQIQRKKADTQWAERFLNQNWQQVLQDWNSQAVLQNTHSLSRDKSYYSLNSLKYALTEFSLARQSIDKNRLQPELLWLFGEWDEKYVRISKNMIKKGWPGQVNYIKQAGHRLYLDNPQAFLGSLSEFLANKIEML